MPIWDAFCPLRDHEKKAGTIICLMLCVSISALLCSAMYFKSLDTRVFHFPSYFLPGSGQFLPVQNTGRSLEGRSEEKGFASCSRFSWHFSAARDSQHPIIFQHFWQPQQSSISSPSSPSAVPALVLGNASFTISGLTQEGLCSIILGSSDLTISLFLQSERLLLFPAVT